MAKVSKKDKDIIETAVKRLKVAVKADDHNRTAAIDDLKFAHGDQWDQREKKRRSDKGRPALTINLLPKFIDQVVGDILHNTPTVKIRPINSHGDVNIAKIRQGIISNIEYLSNSKGIYGYATRQQVTSGYGAWRVLTRYTEENPFLQEIYLEGIRNPFLVYMDPSSKDQNYADARWGFLLEKVPKAEFEERYPKATLPGDNFPTKQGLADELWYDGENVTVAEYFEKTTEPVMMVQLEDGRVCTEEEYDTIKNQWKEKQKELYGKLEMMVENGQPNLPSPPMPGAPPVLPQPGQPPQPQMPQAPPQAPQQPDPLTKMMEEVSDEPKVAKRQTTDTTVIRHRIITCCEILSGGNEGKKFPGKFIPLILLKGKELNIEGRNHVYSLIRNAKDPQKLINYWNTSAAETIALAPKVPWIGTAKQFEGYEGDYASANVDNLPFLKYNPDEQAPGPPVRQHPGQPPVAIFEQIRRGEENLKSVIGMFNADVGAPGSEQTGAAVIARQRPGDIATFEFGENLARAIMFTGRIINEMIPEIYDTERDVRVRGFDESDSFVPINTTVGNALDMVKKEPDRFEGMDLGRLRSMYAKDGKDAKYNDITVGKYDVAVAVGPSYSTQRQESAQYLMQLTQSMPQQMAIAADLVVQSLDFKDADEVATRIRKTLPQHLVKPKPGEQQAPYQPPPQVQLMQAKLQIEQGKSQLQQLKVQQETIKLEHEKVKMQLELAKLQAEGGKQPPQPDPMDRKEKEVRLLLEADRLKLEREKFNHQRDHDSARVDMDYMDSIRSYNLEQAKMDRAE